MVSSPASDFSSSHPSVLQLAMQLRKNPDFFLYRNYFLIETFVEYGLEWSNKRQESKMKIVTKKKKGFRALFVQCGTSKREWMTKPQSWRYKSVRQTNSRNWIPVFYFRLSFSHALYIYVFFSPIFNIEVVEETYTLHSIKLRRGKKKLYLSRSLLYRITCGRQNCSEWKTTSIRIKEFVSDYFEKCRQFEFYMFCRRKFFFFLVLFCL